MVGVPDGALQTDGSNTLSCFSLQEHGVNGSVLALAAFLVLTRPWEAPQPDRTPHFGCCAMLVYFSSTSCRVLPFSLGLPAPRRALPGGGQRGQGGPGGIWRGGGRGLGAAGRGKGRGTPRSTVRRLKVEVFQQQREEFFALVGHFRLCLGPGV